MGLATFYLKYRPQKLAELDLEEVSQGLLKIAKSGKFPHAFLFAGPKGTGKTSAARILAKVINCQKPKDGEPCNECEACLEITNGTALDLIEIDAASNRGIDDIRALKETIKLSPVKLKYKVYIIDEVHMLTTEAFNALLKTLEEPPAHAIFILCTTAPEKLPETIVSRCTRFNFRKAKPQEIVQGPLRRAVEGENLKVEKGVLEEIARSVDGSFRDAHKILEQLALEGKKITLVRTKELLGQVEELSPEKLFGFLATANTQGALKEIDRVVQRGGDLEIYTLRILETLRAGLLAKIGVEEGGPEVLKDFDIFQIKTLISLFSRAAGELRFAPIPQLPLELAVVEWGEEKMSNVKCQMSKSANPSFKSSPQLKEIEEKWPEILAKIKPQNHSVEALLKASRPKDFQNNWLTLEVFYKFHKERLETEKCRRIVEEVVSQTLGRPVKLKCILGEKKANLQLNQQSTASDNELDILAVANEIFNGKIIQ
ncbi:MAG: DNA polymerase III subunit gamma/tau [Microgenomates group bacterium]